MSRDGYVELVRSVSSIHVGARHRTAMGDLAALCASIQRLGLLQPITITPDGTLVCGARRMAAVTKLGWTSVRVWVTSGISTRAHALLAERDENLVREPLCPSDAAALYTELKRVLADDAAGRQGKTQFGADALEGSPEHDQTPGPGESPGPGNDATPGEARSQAARLVTGRDAWQRLDHAAEVRQLATDPDTPADLRVIAGRELAAMDEDGAVHPHYVVVRAAQIRRALLEAADDPNQPAQLREQATAAAARLDPEATTPTRQLMDETRRGQAVLSTMHTSGEAPHGQAGNDSARASTSGQKRLLEVAGSASSPSPPVAESGPTGRVGASCTSVPSRRMRSVRAFVLMWEELAGWHEHYDPVTIGRELGPEQWDAFLATVQGTQQFAEQAAHARTSGDSAA